MFWVQNLFLEKFLDRSASFFGQETHEHVKTIKNCCLEATDNIFRLQTAFFDSFNVLMSFLAEK